jgi:uncharacterized protein DUF2877
MPPPPPLRVAALSLGPEAAALRQTPVPGRVLAVLRTAVYLEAESGAILGLVGADAPDGPLTIRVHDLSVLRLALRDHQGAAFHSTPAALTLAGTTQIAWDDIPTWSPTPPATLALAPARAAAAHALAALLPPRDFGLRITACELDEMLDPQSAIQTLKSKIIALLGRGPGLTPSGDDILMGLLAALQWQARLGALASEPISALTAAVLAAAPQQTTRLSTRLLHHAAAGTLYAPAMDLGAALLAGDPASVPAPAARLFAIGHTSGADMAHGLLLGTLRGLQGDLSIG